MLLPLFIRHKDIWKRVELEDVICLKTEGNYTTLNFRNKASYVARSTMAGALKRLPEELFVRTDRSHAASIYHITAIHKDKLELIMSDKSRIPFSKNMYKQILKQLTVFE